LEVVLTNAFGEPANDKEAHFFAYFESLDLDVFLKWFMILCVGFLEHMIIFILHIQTLTYPLPKPNIDL